MADPETGNTTAVVEGTEPPQVSSQQTTQSVVNADGTMAEGWLNQFAEADREMLGRFKTFKDLGNSFVQTKRKLGKDPNRLVEVPDAASSEDERQNFYKTIGVPDTVDDYKFEKSPDISEKVDIVESALKSAAVSAKKHNMTNEQFNGFVNDYLVGTGKDIEAFEQNQLELAEQNRLAGVKVLEKEFGAGIISRTERAESLINRYGQKIVTEEDGTQKTLVQKLEEEIPAVKDSPWLRLIFDNIAEDMAPARIGNVAAVDIPTTSQIDEKIAKIRSNPAYMDRSHPQHKRLQAEVEELCKKKSGGK